MIWVWLVCLFQFLLIINVEKEGLIANFHLLLSVSSFTAVFIKLPNQLILNRFRIKVSLISPFHPS